MSGSFDTTLFSKYFGDSTDETSARHYMGIAKRLKNARRDKDAIPLLEEGTKNFPKDFLLWFTLGKSLFHDGQVDLATEVLSKAIKLKPDDQQAQALLYRSQIKPATDDSSLLAMYYDGPVRPERYIVEARRLREAGKEEDTIELLREGMRNFPTDFFIPFKLGKSLYFLNHFEESQEALKIALEIRPSDQQAQRLLEKVNNAAKNPIYPTSKAPFLGQ